MILFVLTRAQAQHVQERITDEPLRALVDRVLRSADILPEPDDFLPAAISLRYDGVVTVTFADRSLKDLVWEGLKAEKKHDDSDRREPRERPKGNHDRARSRRRPKPTGRDPD